MAVQRETEVPFDGEAAAAPHAAGLAQKSRSMKFGAIAGGVALMLIAAVSGVRYFQSSVSQAAATAAAAAARQVEATAARTAAGVAATAAAAPAAPAPAPAVQTRIVYVREPAKKEPAQPVETPAVLPQVPIAVTLPDVNLQTSAPETGGNANSQRSATSELTRSARATAPRTALPRP